MKFGCDCIFVGMVVYVVKYFVYFDMMMCQFVFCVLEFDFQFFLWGIGGQCVIGGCVGCVVDMGLYCVFDVDFFVENVEVVEIFVFVFFIEIEVVQVFVFFQIKVEDVVIKDGIVVVVWFVV